MVSRVHTPFNPNRLVKRRTNEWVEIVEPSSGNPMFVNLSTGDLDWHPPPDASIRPQSSNQWWELFDVKTGRYYYYNATSKRTIWQRPFNGDIIPLARIQSIQNKSESSPSVPRSISRENSFSNDSSCGKLVQSSQSMGSVQSTPTVARKHSHRHTCQRHRSVETGTQTDPIINDESPTHIYENRCISEAVADMSLSSPPKIPARRPLASPFFERSQQSFRSHRYQRNDVNKSPKESYKLRSRQGNDYYNVTDGSEDSLLRSGNDSEMHKQKYMDSSVFICPSPALKRRAVPTLAIAEPQFKRDINQSSWSSEFQKKSDFTQSLSKHRQNEENPANQLPTSPQHYYEGSISSQESSSNLICHSPLSSNPEALTSGYLSNSQESLTRAENTTPSKSASYRMYKSSSTHSSPSHVICTRSPLTRSCQSVHSLQHAAPTSLPPILPPHAPPTVSSLPRFSHKASLSCSSTQPINVSEPTETIYDEPPYTQDEEIYDDVADEASPLTQRKASLVHQSSLEHASQAYNARSNSRQNGAVSIRPLSMMVPPYTGDYSSDLFNNCSSTPSSPQAKMSPYSMDDTAVTNEISSQCPLQAYINENWRQTRKSSTFSKKKPQNSSDILNFSKDSLRSPLLNIQEKSLRRDSLDCFKKVQMFMGERKNTNEKITLALELAVKGWECQAIRDEILLQICKQLKHNPTICSYSKGWELMSIMLNFFPPSNTFIRYFEHFLREQSRLYIESSNTVDNRSTESDQKVLAEKYANFCLRQIERTFGDQRKCIKKPTAIEVQSAIEVIYQPSMFDCTLEEIMVIQKDRFPNYSFPWIQITLSQALFRLRGHNTEGIFRVSGDYDEVNALKRQLNKFNNVECTDPHVVATLLKQWYRDLYNPLVPSNFYSECINNCKDKRACLNIVNKMPKINKLVLTYLIRFLQIFLQPENVIETKMDILNLATIMAPNCLRSSTSDPHVLLLNTGKEMEFMKTLIESLDTEYLKEELWFTGRD